MRRRQRRRGPFFRDADRNVAARPDGDGNRGDRSDADDGRLLGVRGDG